MIKNIMTVDLEDHFCDLPFNMWKNYESRIVSTTKTILDLFDKHKTQATFFTVGFIAEQHPELIQEVISRGHEIASHSYSHPNLKEITKENFESDLVKSIESLRKISGGKILGFRAPWFSITKNNFWVFDILKKHLKYDSSIFPIGPHYGFPNAPRYIYKMSEDDPLKEDNNGDFFELPMMTYPIPVLGNFPIAGGIYLRFLPDTLVKNGIKKFNRSGHPAICYIHPEDLDFNRPHLEGTSWHNYWGLKNAYKKLESILTTFNFSSACDVLNL